ncbi:hypothetical protein H2203_001646 [Taxawa tesnikishii (nom. ined.)]|nr:hypothetical protein H2203_001646 [Dothideales sp. JES 119]
MSENVTQSIAFGEGEAFSAFRAADRGHQSDEDSMPSNTYNNVPGLTPDGNPEPPLVTETSSSNGQAIRTPSDS